jgi:hypothetical protein
MTRHHLLVSDFDQTLSFNDSGHVLSEMLGIAGFDEKVAGSPGSTWCRRAPSWPTCCATTPSTAACGATTWSRWGGASGSSATSGRSPSCSTAASPGHRFAFYVVSAAPEEVVHSALDGLVPRAHVFGTRFGYAEGTGEIGSVERVAAGYGKVAAVDALRVAMAVPRDRVVYVGDGSSTCT